MSKKAEYVFYIGVGDLPPVEAKAHLDKVRDTMKDVMGVGRSLFIPVRGSDSRVELLTPTSRQQRAWELYMTLLGNEAEEPVPSKARQIIARYAFEATRDFEAVEAQELLMDAKPCPECGGTGEMEGLRGSELD